MSRLVLWSCGGGRQSAGIAALILEGRLPRPDHVAMVRLEWELGSVWPYVDTYIRPAMARLGIRFTTVLRAAYANHDFWSGADGTSTLLPIHTNQSGKPSKLPEFCSQEWKQRVMLRWAAEQPRWKEQEVECWIGISLDEQRRRRAPVRKWFQPVYPLLDICPIGVAGCLAAVERAGWPEPPRSRCYHCPNQSDAEWAELTPKEWELACQRDELVRETDPHAYLHRQLIPLRQVTLDLSDRTFTGGCSAGTCF